MFEKDFIISKGGTWTDVIRVGHDVHNESKTSCVHMSHEYDIRPSHTLTHDEILFSHMPFTVHKKTKISQSYKHLTKHTQRRCSSLSKLGQRDPPVNARQQAK